MPRVYFSKTGWCYEFIKASSVCVILVSRIKIHLNDHYKSFLICIINTLLADVTSCMKEQWRQYELSSSVQWATIFKKTLEKCWLEGTFWSGHTSPLKESPYSGSYFSGKKWSQLILPTGRWDNTNTYILPLLHWNIQGYMYQTSNNHMWEHNVSKQQH